MCKFKVGDVLRVREWDDLVNEYGYSKGYIHCKVPFVQIMKRLCGETFTVRSVQECKWFSGVNTLSSLEEIEETIGAYITEDMLEYNTSHNEINADDAAFDEFINTFKVL